MKPTLRQKVKPYYTVGSLVLLMLFTNKTLAQRTPPDYKAIEILEDHSVQFRIKAPEAEKVVVWGSWNPTERIEMVKSGDLFEAKVGPLEPNVYEYEYVIDGVSALDPNSKFEESLVKDIIPFVEGNYRAIPEPGKRAVAGFSMGGYQTQNITNAHPEMFGYIGVMSMGLFSSFNSDTGRDYDKDQHVSQLKAVKNAKPKLYWIGMGTDDFLYQTAVALRALYDEVGLPYEYMENPGTHDWNSWRMYLKTLAPRFFK